jgi:cation diffusion facilitator CzcD-associated flavoprotein CzcO
VYRRLPILQRATRLAIYLFRESFVVTFAHPALMRPARRLALWNMTRSIADPALRARLTPAYAMGCKRILLSSEYYPTVAQSNVEVVTTGIREIRPHATVWMTGGCASWYVDRTGRNSTLWPGSSWSFYRRVSRFRPADYVSTDGTAVTV